MQRRFYLSLFQHLNVKIFEHWVITMLCVYVRMMYVLLAI